MQILINYSGVDNSDALESHTRDSLERAIGRFGDRLTRVEVHLSDLNSSGKQGPEDKRCMIEARPAGRDPIVVENRCEDFYSAIKDSVDKLRTSLERRLEKD